MNGKSLVLLLLAVVSGLGAMYGTSKLLASKDKRVRPAHELQDVLVAARDLKVEETLKPDLVKVIQMSKTDVPAGAFSSIKDVEDRWVTIKTLQDEPILDKKLAPKGTPSGIVPRIPKGMRAISVEVNESTGVAGFVLPDHRVDVVQTVNGARGESEAETLLQDALVMAVGQTFTRPEDRSIQVRTVTLALTPEQAELLVAARSKGALSLSLRGLNDREQVAHTRPKQVAAAEAATSTASTAAVKPPPPPPPPAVPPPPRFVTIYRGIDQSKRVRIDSSEAEDDDPPAGEGFR